MAAKRNKTAPRAVKPDRAKATQAKRAPSLRRLLAAPPLHHSRPVILWVPSYNRTEPALGGIPFFYWYQLAWILVGSVVVLIVYLLETRVTRVTRRAGADVDPGATGDVL